MAPPSIYRMGTPGWKQEAQEGQNEKEGQERHGSCPINPSRAGRSSVKLSPCSVDQAAGCFIGFAEYTR